MKTQTNSLQRIIARMLTENVGRHPLDSGGAYGRHWERNQGKNVAYWRARPEVNLNFEIWEHGGKEQGFVNPTISVFHFLNKCLDNYDKKLTRQLWGFAETVENRNKNWLELIPNWLGKIEAENGDLGGEFYNTCNGDCCLSQDLQSYEFRLNGDDFIILQIHGGCDLRGGYTRPRIFALSRYPDKTLWDRNHFSISDGENYWDYDFSSLQSAGNYKSGKESSFDFLKDCPFTSNEKEKGKGKIYVDKEGNGYSPINGNKLEGYI